MSDDGSRDQLDGFSRTARRAVALAEQEARALDHHHIGTEHLLLGVLATDGSAGCSLLRDAGVTFAAVRRLVAEAPAAGGAAAGMLDLTPRANRAIVRSTRFSHQRRAEEIGTGHLLLGVIDVEGTAALILRRLNADVERVTGAAADELVDAPQAPGSIRGDAPRSAGDLVCPRCGSTLALSYSIVRARSRSGDERDAAVFSCESCGHVLGVSGARSAGPG